MPPAIEEQPTPRFAPTYLVQRLSPPPPMHNGRFSKAHRVFGGGMLGLKEEAWDILDQVFLIEYMGAAEFEWGVIPRFLQDFLRLAEEGQLTAFSFVIPKKGIRPSWRREAAQRNARREELRRHKEAGTKAPRAKPLRAASDRSVAVLGPSYWRSEMEARIRELAKGEGRLKESANFTEALDPDPNDSHPVKTCGWMELTNGFFFFLDETMWRGTAAIFGLEVPE